MELNLRRKHVAITGASKGIGKAIKEMLEEEGCIVNDLSKSNDFDLEIKDNLVEAGEIVKDCDILINNVGGGGTWDDYYAIMNKNYFIMHYLTSLFLEKDKPNGRVITISSIYGKEKGPNPGFVAAKAAQIAYMKSMAGQYGGVTFNTICPGCIDTKPSIKEYATKYNMPLGKPEDVAGIVTFLCSDKASHITGTTITVDGGDSKSF